ncbi:hypothetical protein M5E87_09860 [Flavonifractor plautii]|nr:hypothetical protein M5E87_09860 [Flavonifractor plautii]
MPGHRRRVLQQLHRLLRGHEAGRHSPQRGQLRPLALLPIDALRMATVNGGKALGRLTGRIEGATTPTSFWWISPT